MRRFGYPGHPPPRLSFQADDVPMDKPGRRLAPADGGQAMEPLRSRLEEGGRGARLRGDGRRERRLCPGGFQRRRGLQLGPLQRNREGTGPPGPYRPSMTEAAPMTASTGRSPSAFGSSSSRTISSGSR